MIGFLIKFTKKKKLIFLLSLGKLLPPLPPPYKYSFITSMTKLSQAQISKQCYNGVLFWSAPFSPQGTSSIIQQIFSTASFKAFPNGDSYSNVKRFMNLKARDCQKARLLLRDAHINLHKISEYYLGVLILFANNNFK